MRILLTALTVVLCLAAGAAAAVPEQPEKLPELLQTAIDAKDSASAMPHLDLERLVSGIFEDSLAQINESVQKGELILSPPLAAALGSLNSGNAVTRRTAIIFLTSEIGKLLVYGVDSGSFAGRPLPEDQRRMMDGGVFSRFGDVSLERKEFSDAKLLRNDGKTALIQTRLYDYGVRQSYLLQLRLELTDGLWKAVSVENAADLYKSLQPQR